MKLARIKQLARRLFKNNNNIMPELNFVIPGHYKTRGSTNDTMKVIRVLGESPDNPGYFNTSDGQLMSESDILANYEFIKTVTAGEYEGKVKNIKEDKIKKLFRGGLDVSPVKVDEPGISTVGSKPPVDENPVTYTGTNDRQDTGLEVKIEDHTSITMEDMTLDKYFNQGKETPMFINFIFPSPVSFAPLSSAIQILDLDEEVIGDKLLERILKEHGFMNAFREFVTRRLQDPGSEDIPVVSTKPEIDIDKLREQIRAEEQERLLKEQKNDERDANDYAREMFDKIISFVERIDRKIDEIKILDMSPEEVEDINKLRDIDPAFSVPVIDGKIVNRTTEPSTELSNETSTGTIDEPMKENEDETLDSVDKWMKEHGLI